MKDHIFLTSSEALEAVRIDLMSYGSQRELEGPLLALLGEMGCRGQRGETIPLERRIESLKSQNLSLEELIPLCMLVFSTPVQMGSDSKGHSGLWVETGMESFACTRCGQCCLKLDIHLDCTESDVEMWIRSGRDDIMAWVGQDVGIDGQVEYRVWRYPDTPYYTETCPWLRRVPGDTAFVCSIQDVKPEVCRFYPGTAKHARMTGCPGLGGSPKP